MLRNRILYITLLIGLTFAYIYTNSYIGLMFLVLLLAITVLSFVVLLTQRNKVSLSSDCFYSSDSDDSVQLNVKTENTSVFPVSVKVCGKVENTFCTGTSKFATRLYADAKGVKMHSFTISDLAPGNVTANLEKAYLYDFLGIFSIKLNCPEEKQVTVFPKGCEFTLTTEAGTFSSYKDGEKYSLYKKGNDINEIFSLRDYVEGDSLRSIHWKLSAKQGRLITKEYGLPMSFPITVFVDPVITDEKTSKDALEKLLDLLASISQQLILMDLGYTLVFADKDSSELRSYEVSSFEDLTLGISGILSASSYKSGFKALTLYKESIYCSSEYMLVYLSTVLRDKDISEIKTVQRVETLTVTPDKLGDDYAWSINL